VTADTAPTTTVASDQLHRILAATLAVWQAGSDPRTDATIRLESDADGRLLALVNDDPDLYFSASDTCTAAAATAACEGGALAIHLEIAIVRMLLAVLADQMDTCCPDSPVTLQDSRTSIYASPVLEVDIEDGPRMSVVLSHPPLHGELWRGRIAAAANAAPATGQAYLNAPQTEVIAALSRHGNRADTTLRACDADDRRICLLVDADDLCAVITVVSDPRPEHTLAASLACERATA